MLILSCSDPCQQNLEPWESEPIYILTVFELTLAGSQDPLSLIYVGSYIDH